MSSLTETPSIGLAITTVGRPALRDLLRSVELSGFRPRSVCIANQGGRPLDLSPSEYSFPLRVVDSAGGASRGRNDAVAAFEHDVDVIGFPNDHSRYDGDCLQQVAAAFAESPQADAIACSLVEGETARFALPPAGRLDRMTVWRAIEPAMFVRQRTFERLGGFREDLGTGCPSPWKSGEGTDLLLRIMEEGGTVESRPDIHVSGAGERRDLDADMLVAKHRGYARGTGRVYRLHPYPLWVRARIVAAPWLRLHRHDPSLRLSLRLALARSLGRVEGLSGRVLPSRPANWLGQR
ncbi:glycosyltransferase family 2 protein [Geodermatophilus sp. SYSU D01062]